jgi:hypothetical protein
MRPSVPPNAAKRPRSAAGAAAETVYRETPSRAPLNGSGLLGATTSRPSQTTMRLSPSVSYLVELFPPTPSVERSLDRIVV